jgi:hypothetical protein
LIIMAGGCGNSAAGNWWVTEGLEHSQHRRCHGGSHVPVAFDLTMVFSVIVGHCKATGWSFNRGRRMELHWEKIPDGLTWVANRSLGAFFHHQRWLFSPPPDHQRDKTDHWSQITSMTHELPLGELLSPLSGVPFRDGSDLLKINVMINQTMMLHNWSDLSKVCFIDHVVW